MAILTSRRPGLQYARKLQIQTRSAYTQVDHHHDDHHAVSYQHLERPPITPDNFQVLRKWKSFAEVPELQKETLMKNHGNLVAKDAYPEVCWSEQIINSASVMSCLSEIFGTEFEVPNHTYEILKAIYIEQERVFLEEKIPKLQSEGISSVTIDLLKEIYFLRANIQRYEFDLAIHHLNPKPGFFARFNPFASKEPVDANAGMRSMTDGSKWYERPLVLSNLQNFTMNAFLPGYFESNFLPWNNVKPDGFENNYEWAQHNVKTFRRVQAFVNAVERGLTESEKDQIISKLKEFKGQIKIDAAVDAEIRATVKEMFDTLRTNGDRNEFNRKVDAFVKEYDPINSVEGVHAKQILSVALKQYKDSRLSKKPQPSHEKEDGLFLREGYDYFSGEQQRKAFHEELIAWFRYKMSLAHHEVMTTGTAETKTMSSKLKQAVDYFLSPEIQKDLEILSLFRHSELSFKQKDEFLEIFADQAVKTHHDDAVLMNVLHPHRLTLRLFGDKIKLFLSGERVEYTEKFTDGSCSYIPRDDQLTPKQQKLNQNIIDSGVLVAPMISPGFFATGQDHVFHIKLMRLFEDYYGMDLSSEEGLALIDDLVHTYDISPGEDTLERSQVIPMPEHTFDELPIMKFDGWEDCDVEPEPDRTVENYDTSAIEDTIRQFLKEVTTKTGQPIELSTFRENNKLTSDQYSVLRGVLHLEKSDERRVRLLEKIWGVVLPKSELDRLFRDQYKKFENRH